MRTLIVTAAVSAALGLGLVSAARADCESDLNQLEAAYKAPKLSPDAKASLDKAKDVAVSALRKDDDEGCHKAIVEALPKAGMTLK